MDFLVCCCCCWLFKLFVGSSLLHQYTANGPTLGYFDIYESLFNGYRNVETCDISTIANTPHHRLRIFALLCKSILFDISMEIIRMNMCDCACVYVSQVVHKFCAQLNSLKRNVWFGNAVIAWHRQMPNDYYYYVFIRTHHTYIYLASDEQAWMDGKTFACVTLIHANEFSCIVTSVCQCVKHLSLTQLAVV